MNLSHLKQIKRPSSTWTDDFSFEKRVTEYLKTTSIPEELGIYEYVENLPEQKQGIDYKCAKSTIIRRDNKFYRHMQEEYIDAKAIAAILPTFAFELSGVRSTGQIGWLLNPNVLTDSYLLICLDIRKFQENTHNYVQLKRNFNISEIYQAEIIHIKKADVLDIIFDELNLTKNQLIELVDECRKLADNSEEQLVKIKYDKQSHQCKLKRKDDKLKIHFTVSKNFIEQPVNIIINKSYLKERANVWHYSYAEQWSKNRSAIASRSKIYAA